MLADISISQWSMRKYDRKISNEITTQYNADSESARLNKLLIAIDEGRKITQAAGEARTFHYTNTLPWTDEGKRILPSANFFDYVRELNVKKHKFWRIVESFWNKYDVLKEESKVKLGDLFKEEDYPPLEHLRSKYRFNISFVQIPDAKDFRVDLGTEAVNQIKLEIEQSVKDAERIAVKDMWERLHEAIQHIIDRLSSKDAIFRDTLIGNVIELTDLLPKLNFNNDPHLNDLCKELTQSICTIAPESIRKDASLRKATANKAGEIIKKVEEGMEKL
jgi:hypothetical protein